MVYVRLTCMALFVFFMVDVSSAHAASRTSTRCTFKSPDFDKDGWPDCMDGCPKDPQKRYRGACGCGVADSDTDGDTHLDCHETCDTDPLKNSAGICGCGVADTDSDDDGKMDCNETCDSDPLKTEPGICGCGTPDTNLDSDEKLDCEEQCDLDALKTDPLVCGCGVADTDTDGDTIANCIDPTPDGDPLPEPDTVTATPKVLVIVEAATRDFALSQGLTEDDIVENIFVQIDKVEQNFNNGEFLPYVFDFQIIDVQFKSLPTPVTTLPSQTPETEDITITYDTRYAGSPHAGNGGVMIKSIDFGNPNPEVIVQTHEIAHIFGAVDMYVSQIVTNEVYPGASWAMQSKGYMGTSDTFGRNWEEITQEIIRACEAKIPHPHAYSWFLSWEPDQIKINAIDENGNSVPEAIVSVYRSPHYWRTLYETDLYATGITDIAGQFTIPYGLVGESTRGYKFYDKYMVSIEYQGETYIHWLSAYHDILLPYLDGNEDLLELDMVIDEAHRYRAPAEQPQATTDIEITSLTASPTSVKYGDVVTRSFVIKNNGPDAYVGTLGFQMWLSKSTDTIFDGADVGFGGYNKNVTIESGASYTYTTTNSIALSVPLGANYLMGTIKISPPYTTTPETIVYTDPNLQNNAKVGSTITVNSM